ncbi:MAG: hypothetical protein NC388_06155 [Clostridium sp.]|nr:hypothetical protein [Clostridium sp.]
MQQILNRCLWAFALLGALLCIPVASNAQSVEDEEPIIVLKSRVYEASGVSGVFTVLLGGTEEGYIDVDCGIGAEEYELKQATYDSTTGALTGTLITCSATPEGVVKIYGDPTKIDVLSVSGAYLTEAEFSKLSNLAILDLSHNELTALDLTPFSAIQSIDVSDNPFNVKPLVVGGNKPELAILDIGRITRMDQSFSLTDYPNLITFDAWGNTALVTLDPTQCPELRKISIDGSMVKSLDVTKNSKLNILNISDTGIEEIDVTQNPYLEQFYCDHMSGTTNKEVKLNTLDVTKNPNLIYLYANGNNLTELNVANNVYLRDLVVGNNKLTHIDLSKNRNLLNVSLLNNNFTYATLPLPNDEWYTYYYRQNPMVVAKSQKEGTVLDFSDKVLREGSETTVALFRTSESNPSALTELSEDYYTYEDGKVTLLKAVPDSVYIAFANDAFPESGFSFNPLCTNKFMVKTEANYGADDRAITFRAPVMSSEGTAITFGLGMYGATPENPKKFYVDYGKGKVEYTAVSEEAPAVPNVTEGVTTSGAVTVYVPEGEWVSAFDMENITLTSIDFSAVPALRSLRLVNAGIYGSDNINLAWNRYLSNLELTGNHFSSLNIRGVNDAYQKNLLHTINLSNNELQEVTLNDNRTIYDLNLSNNKLTEFSLKDADYMLSLNLSGNQLTTVDINYCTLMTYLNVADNRISSIVLPAEISLKEVHCENNALVFNTLPVIDGLTAYTYAPQNEITIAKIGPGVDLSKYNLEKSATEYVWKKTDGTVLVKGAEYTEEDGKTRFYDALIGSKVYCEMSNPMFDGLVLKTSALEVAAMPTTVIASFTTTAAQTANLILRAEEENTPVYIDWLGSEVELVEYLVGTEPTSFEVTTHKNATVRIYSYDENSKLTVFSASGLPMSTLDVSKLTNLINLSAVNSGLTSVKWPETNTLREINLGGNNFSSIDLTRYSDLYQLTLDRNKFTTFDASVYPNLQILSLAGNNLTSFKGNNKLLWSLTLSNNQLTDIDLSNMPDMYQLSLAGNQLSHIDVSMLNKMKVLFLDQNKFKFSTLPLDNGYALYTYANQEPLAVDVADGKVDLSSEAVVNDTETEYRWFVGVPTVDETGELVGEELYIDDEYLLDGGVTTFTRPVDNVMCVMTNMQLPNLFLYTQLIDVKSTGIESVTADGNRVSVDIDSHTIIVKATKDVPVRLIGMNGMQVCSAATANGTCTLSGIASGAYVVVVGNTAYKVLVK